jgi:hypothetical protein
MWDKIPEPIRNLFGMPPAYHYAPMADTPDDWSMVSLCWRLGLDPQQARLITDLNTFPAGFRYRHFSIPKPNGGVREIVEPGKLLMAAQRRILKTLLNKVQPHAAAYGFRRKKSIADHAWAHTDGRVIITADIQDFFPSTTRQRVKEWWHGQGYKTPEVRLLTALTTYRGALPQGAPTSPPLSNLLNAEMDTALTRRVAASGGTYTRYADDLAFSWPDGYLPPADVEMAVRGVLRQYGYSLHPDKGWHVWDRRDEPTITGVVVTRRGTVDIPDSMKHIMRTLGRSADPDDQVRLAGYKGYQQMITRPAPPQPEPTRSKRLR